MIPIVFSASRSGSTLLMNYLGVYYNIKNGMISLNEFFNPDINFILDINDIRQNPIQLSTDTKTKINIIKNRLEFFKKLPNNEKYLIKLTPFPIKYYSQCFEYFNNKEYQFIILRRRSWIEQTLSMIIAQHEQKWFSFNELKCNHKEYQCTYKDLEDRCFILMSFENRCKEIMNKINIFYEDFYKDHDNISNLLNLSDWKNIMNNYKTKLKMTRPECGNLCRFNNKSQIIEWGHKLYEKYLKSYDHYITLEN